jgi:hypothetical protein
MRGSGISEAAAKASAAETRALLQNPLLAPPAGGPGGRITERGRKVIGISGEVRALACRFLRLGGLPELPATGLRLAPALRLLLLLLLVYRLGDDPKVSTAAQRTWLPAHDPGVKAMLHVRSRARKGPTLAPPLRPPPPCVQPPPPAMSDSSFLSLPIHGHAAATVVRAQPGAPHGRLAAYAGAPVVVTAVTAKSGAASRVSAGGTQVWADE